MNAAVGRGAVTGLRCTSRAPVRHMSLGPASAFQKFKQDWKQASKGTYQRWGPWIVAGCLGGLWIWWETEQAKRVTVPETKMSKREQSRFNKEIKAENPESKAQEVDAATITKMKQK